MKINNISVNSLLLMLHDSHRSKHSDCFIKFIDIVLELYSPVHYELRAEMRAIQNSLLYGTAKELEIYIEELQQKLDLRYSYKRRSQEQEKRFKDTPDLQQINSSEFERHGKQQQKEHQSQSHKDFNFPQILVHNHSEKYFKMAEIPAHFNKSISLSSKELERSMDKNKQNKGSSCNVDQEECKLQIAGSKKMSSSKIKDQIMSKSQQKNKLIKSSSNSSISKLKNGSVEYIDKAVYLFRDEGQLENNSNLQLPKSNYLFSSKGSDNDRETKQKKNSHLTKLQNKSSDNLSLKNNNSSKALLKIVRKKTERNESSRVESKEHEKVQDLRKCVDEMIDMMVRNEAQFGIEEELGVWSGAEDGEKKGAQNYSEMFWNKYQCHYNEDEFKNSYKLLR